MTDYKPTHTGLCGIIGGYGYCTCGLDEYKAQLAKKEEQLLIAVEVLGQIVDEFSCTIDSYYKLGPHFTHKDGTEVFEVSILLDRAELIEKGRAALEQIEQQEKAE